MSRIARIVLPDVPHHITQRGVRSINVFFIDEDRHFYMELVRSVAEELGLTILSYCLMNNHVHLLIIPKKKKI